MELIRVSALAIYCSFAESFEVPFFEFQASHFAFPFTSRSPGRSEKKQNWYNFRYITLLCHINSPVFISPTLPCLNNAYNSSKSSFDGFALRFCTSAAALLNFWSKICNKLYESCSKLWILNTYLVKRHFFTKKKETNELKMADVLFLVR